MAYNSTILTSAEGFVITPSTNGATKFTAFGVYVGGTGGQYKDVNLIDSRGNTLLFKGVPVGDTIHLVVSAVRTTNTTSTASLIGYGPQ